MRPDPGDAVRPKHTNYQGDTGDPRVANTMGGDEEVLGLGEERGILDENAGQEQNEILESQEDIEDTEPKASLPTPLMPSRSEVEEHTVDHLPYRAWCEFCNEGRGREFAHPLVKSERMIPIMRFDYMFITRRGVHSRAEFAKLSGE